MVVRIIHQRESAAASAFLDNVTIVAEQVLPEEGSVQAAIELKEEIRAQKNSKAVLDGNDSKEELDKEMVSTPGNKKSGKKFSCAAQGATLRCPILRWSKQY
jgi:hypothetical protein